MTLVVPVPPPIPFCTEWTIVEKLHSAGKDMYCHNDLVFAHQRQSYSYDPYVIHTSYGYDPYVIHTSYGYDHCKLISFVNCSI